MAFFFERTNRLCKSARSLTRKRKEDKLNKSARDFIHNRKAEKSRITVQDAEIPSRYDQKIDHASRAHREIIRSDGIHAELTIPNELQRYLTNGTSNPMSNEITKSVNEDGEVTNNDNKHNVDSKEGIENTNDNKEKPAVTDKTEKVAEKTENLKEGKENKPRSVSFNRDIHVKRFGKPRVSRGNSSESSNVRKEPFTNLSQKELIEEANRVLAQAKSVTCTADHPPDKFFSLPHRRKYKDDKAGRRNSDDTTPEGKTPLGRSTSDVSSRKRKERTSLSTLFRRQQTNKSPENPVKVSTKPIAIVKRSKSDVSDLKSNTKLNTQTKPIRKRSGSETEEFLKSLRNKKNQLSPIIESSPREDYFKDTPPLEVFQKKKLAEKNSNKLGSKLDSKKVNPVEKPPRYNKSPDTLEPKPPARIKRGKSLSPPITETPKNKTEIKTKLLIDEVDSITPKDINPVAVNDKIKESIKKIEENVYADNTMIHSSQRPPDKPPLTRGHTVGHMVRILREDQSSPKAHLLTQNGTNASQPFSYIKPSVSPDANLFVRNSPDRVPSPVNKITDKGIVYAEVLRDGDRITDQYNKKYSPTRDKYGHQSDEDEGLGYEERYKYTNNRSYNYDHKAKVTENTYNTIDDYKITDSPIKPRFREYRMTSFDELEPTYANDYPSPKEESRDFIDKFRGRGDGMDTKKKSYEPEAAKVDLDFNELSHRRQQLESRLNARRFERDRDRVVVEEPVTRYLTETDPIYEAEKRMKATEKYVNETVRYYRNTLERDGYAESNVTEDYNKYDSENKNSKYHTETRTFQKISKDDDRREFIDRLEPRYSKDAKEFPPEPEYEPPSLESNPGKPVLSPDEYKEKKYKAKKVLTSSHDTLQTGHKYKVRDEYVDKRKGHYASNPEIAQEREEEYANLPKYSESYHNSLRRVKNKDKYKQQYGVRRHDSGDSRDYYDQSPSRFDNRLVDSGIENDFRKDSSGEIHMRHRKYESDDDTNNVSMFLDNERRHTEDNYPGEQIYANTEHLKYKTYREDGYKKEYNSRERSADDGSRYNPKLERYEKSPSRLDDKLSAKPPKAKKLSGLEKMKQLFSRDSSKKSKKEKEKEVQPKTRTRVLKSPEHLAQDDSEYRRYTDPEPSDIVVRKINYDCQGDERRIRSSREDLDYRTPDIRDNEMDRKGGRYRSPDIRDNDIDRKGDRYRSSEIKDNEIDRKVVDRYRSPEIRESDLDRKGGDRYRVPDRDSDIDRKVVDRYRSPDNRDSDVERKYREYDQQVENRYSERTVQSTRYQERSEEKRRYNSSERESDARPSDGESELRKTRSRTARPDSPALAERYRGRRRLATPSPTPSPPRRAQHQPPAQHQPSAQPASGGWFKSLDRLTRKKGKNGNKVEKESTITTEDESRKVWSKPKQPLSPAKNLRFFGDTDPDSDANGSQATVVNSKNQKGTLRKTISNSTNGLDEVDSSLLSSKSYSLSNLHRTNGRESPRNTNKSYYKRNLQNISEIQSNSEAEIHLDRKMSSKPPISPYDRSRSHSSSKTLKAERKNGERGNSIDTRRKVDDRGSSTEVRRRIEDRGSSTDVRREDRERGSSTDVRRRGDDRDSSHDVRRRADDRGSSSELRSSKQELNGNLKHRRRTPGTNSGESSTEGDSSHQSQRSVVYLHATTVGDIPDPGRMIRNRSRDDVSSINSSSLQVRSTTKSFSIFAPWTPKHYNDTHDVHYAQKPRKLKKEPAKLDRPATLQKNKSYSQTTLTRKPTNSRLTSSSQTLYRKPEKRKETPTLRKSVTRDGKKSQSSEIISRDSDRERVSRSVSMPKNNDKKAGWFKMSKKKPEVNTRVR